MGQVLSSLFEANPDKRIIVACFASHVHRVQQVADAALATGRYIATLGPLHGPQCGFRPRASAYSQIPEERLVDIEKIGNLPPSQICVVCTGSQGEPMSALSLMAAGENKWVKTGEGDLVVLSSHAIPGNESNVGKVIDGLCRSGAEVVHSGLAPVHASGHAMRDELKLLISVAKPQAFIPVHGEYRHLMHHARLATEPRGAGRIGPPG